MCKLLLVPLAGALAVGAFNLSTGRELFDIPSLGTVRSTLSQERTQDVVAATALTAKIKAKMALDDLVKAADISVDADGGVVTLTGDVGSADERRRAMRIVTETAGVRRVVNRLRVR